MTIGCGKKKPLQKIFNASESLQPVVKVRLRHRAVSHPMVEFLSNENFIALAIVLRQNVFALFLVCGYFARIGLANLFTVLVTLEMRIFGKFFPV